MGWSKVTWRDWLHWRFWAYCWEAKTWQRFWCRAHGHPNGPWFYRSYGDEPDFRCQDCGENLG